MRPSSKLSHIEMVRVHEWKVFENQARDLFAKNPDNTRFSIKHNTSTVENDSKKKVSVVLKVTDDKQTITYETCERFSVKRISALMKWFTIKMASTPIESLTDENSLKQLLPR